jgi:hypothetical protein
VYRPNRLESVEVGGVNGAAGALAGACASTGVMVATNVTAIARRRIMWLILERRLTSAHGAQL